MTDVLKLGLVGADASGRGWGAMAHIPALRGIKEIELAALCTSRPESAAAAAKTYGINRAYHDINELAAQPDIDIISTVVRIPNHHGIVMAALTAGKHVYCEWPLGANLAETEEMAKVAREKGVVTAIGLQGRHDPTLTYIKQLHEEGWFGEVLSVQMSLISGGRYEYPSRRAWETDRDKGVTLMGIVGGHTLDYIAYCFGAPVEISARTATRIKEFLLADTGEMVAADSADNVMLHGVLTGGALLSYQVSTVPHQADGWRMVVHGSKGMIIASTPVMPQISPITLVGARGDEPPTEMTVPAHLRVVPADMPEGPPRNIGQAYIRMAEAIRAGKPFEPSFDDAVKVHRLLDAIQRSSDQGSIVKLT